MPTEYLDLIGADRENDIVYKVKLEDEEVFIFIMLEHQSKTNFLMPFRLLEYMVKLWRVYIDENAKESETKHFKLPPVFPIVFHDGVYNWTAEVEFKDKVKHYEKFKSHIPNFSYDLVSLSKISMEQLIELGDAISLILAMDKIKKAEDLKVIKQLKEQYWEKLKESLEHSNILENIALAIKQLLKRVNIPEDEIDKVIQALYEKEVEKMFEMVEEYDVQKVRAEEREAGKIEGIIEGKLETAKNLLKMGLTIEQIIEATELSKEKIEEIKRKTHH
jgi:predicted transposase/invertase (TIGR01784 family)